MCVLVYMHFYCCTVRHIFWYGSRDADNPSPPFRGGEGSAGEACIAITEALCLYGVSSIDNLLSLPPTPSDEDSQSQRAQSQVQQLLRKTLSGVTLSLTSETKSASLVSKDRLANLMYHVQ